MVVLFAFIVTRSAERLRTVWPTRTPRKSNHDKLVTINCRTFSARPTAPWPFIIKLNDPEDCSILRLYGRKCGVPPLTDGVQIIVIFGFYACDTCNGSGRFVVFPPKLFVLYEHSVLLSAPPVAVKSPRFCTKFIVFRTYDAVSSTPIDRFKRELRTSYVLSDFEKWKWVLSKLRCRLRA